MLRGISAPSISFKQQSDPALMQDLLVAVGLGATDKNSSVVLNFRHVLSRISFTASINDDDPAYNLSIEGITANGVQLNGSYSLLGVNNGGQLFGGWSPIDGVTANLSPGLIGSAVSNSTPKAVTNITPATGALMVVPQSTKSIVITYTLRHGTTIIGTQSQAATIPVNVLGSSWAAGSNYIYNIKVTPQAPITFSASVSSWTDVNSDITQP